MKFGPVNVLDLGSSKVTLVVAERVADGKLNVLDLVSTPNRGVQRGVITDLEATSDAIREAWSSLRPQSGSNAVTVSVNGAHLEGLNSQGFHPIFPALRTIHSEDVLQVVNHSRQVAPSPDREQIMALPREFRIDGTRGVQRPVGMTGSRLEVVTHLISGQIAHLHNVERAVEMAGLTVAQMVPSPFASALALLSDEERQNGCTVIDLGGGTTGVTIFMGGTVASTSCIPIGGMHVTGDLSKLLKMTMEEAEQLKRNQGRAIIANVKEDAVVEVRQVGQPSPRLLQRRVLYEIIESRCTEIAQLAKAQIERSGMFGMLPGGVVLTGGCANMPGIPQLFAKILRDTNVRIGMPKVEGSAGIRAAAPEFSCVIGLAAYALEEQGDQVAPAAGFESWKERILTLFQPKV